MAVVQAGKARSKAHSTVRVAASAPVAGHATLGFETQRGARPDHSRREAGGRPPPSFTGQDHFTIAFPGLGQ